jgi:hypothetical protein
VPVSGNGIWTSAAELAQKPMSGSAWQNLKSAADRACGTPDLANQDDSANVCYLAKALVFARTQDSSYADAVIAAIESIVASGTYRGRALALGREIGTYAIAADLIQLRRRNSTLDSRFRSKLAELKTTYTESGPANLIDCHEDRPNNWGTHCGASRIAIDLYLGDAADLERAKKVFLGFLGDRSVYAGFTYGSLDWQCDPARPVGINPKGCTRDGHSIDGVIPDDQRRGGGFTWPAPQENYVWENLQGAMAQAVMLQRAGVNVFATSDQALLRSVQWLHTQALYPAATDDVWISHLVNHYYGTSFPAGVASSPGKNLGYTDYTHGR